MRPLELGPNQPRHFYRGGAAIAAFRGTAAQDAFRPEDWVASTTARYGTQTDGLTLLGTGEYLKDAVAADPGAWLGPEHAAYFGASPALLVKLLDAGERLPVHAHPTRSFALRHLGSRHGKTEAWLVLGTKGAEPAVYLGWAHDVEASELTDWVDRQETDKMLASLHRLPVAPGDAVLVPAGTPHAIGEGVFSVELQEPTDFSVMLEFEGFDLDPSAGELGLGRETALACVRREALSQAAVDELVRRASHDSSPVAAALPSAAAPYFRAQRVRARGASTPLEESFAVLVITHGAGALAGGSWRVPLKAGQTWVVPWAAGPCELSGDIELLRCLPPLPADAARDDPGAGR